MIPRLAVAVLTPPLLASVLATPVALAQAPEAVAPRVILIVADGAGVAYWSAARIAGHELAVAHFPVVGLVDSRNVSSSSPESASSASAFATGVATFRRAVSVGPDSQPRRTVLEAAEEGGLATGLVTSTSVVDATPAAFAAHTVTRDSVGSIARQMTESGVDVLLGDGAWAFDPDRREDRRDLLGELARSRAVAGDTAALRTAIAEPPERLVGFFEIDDMEDVGARGALLETMARAALAVLDRDPDGFFLLVETEHTDHLGHDNVSLSVIAAEVVAIDRVVRAAVEYRDDHPETLVVVTGDHETGGLSIHPAMDGWVAEWATGDHTVELVPLFAIGPGAEHFAGILDAAEVGRGLFAAIGAAPPESPPSADER